jgi:hypothetical protein
MDLRHALAACTDQGTKNFVPFYRGLLAESDAEGALCATTFWGPASALEGPSRARAAGASFADAKNGTAVGLTSKSVEERAASRRPDARHSPAYHFGHARRRCHILPGHSSGRST